MGRNSERVARANHKTNKRMSIFRYTQVRSYKTVPNDFFVELKRYFVTQGFKIKRFEYTETSGQMVGRKDGWHLNFVPKFVLDIKQVHGVHFITFNYFARVRKIGIASGIATQGITALIGAATITGYLVAARNLVDAVGKAMDALAGNPLSVEWLEKEEAGENKTGDTTSSTVTYNTTNIQNVGPDPSANNSNTKETNTVVEHHHHYYYGAQNEHAQHMAPPAQAPLAVEEPIIREVEVEVPQHQHRLTIMPSEPAQPFYRQCDLEKELISMMERGDTLAAPEFDMPASNPFMGGANASVYDHQQQGNHNNQYREKSPSPQFFSGGAYAESQQSAPAHNPFTYEDSTPMPQYNLPAQHAPLYSIEPLSYNNKVDNGFRLEELREIAPAMAPQKNTFFVPLSNNASRPQQRSDDPFADLSLENVAGAYGMKTHHQEPIATGEYGYAKN